MNIKLFHSSIALKMSGSNDQPKGSTSVVLDPNLIQHATKSLDQFLARTEIGFPQIVSRQHLWDQSKKIGMDLSRRFSTLVVVGIGGSSLGGRVISEVFSEMSEKEIYFCDNVDALDFERILNQISAESTAWLIISKSGSTLETLVATDLVEQYYHRKNLNLKDRVVVVSEPKRNPLTDWASKNNFIAAEIPLDVGGRFSVLTPVGMIPAAFLGVDVEKIRDGAKAALKQKHLIAELSAQVLASFKRDEWITLFWSYTSLLKSFGLWTQQLWAESLAKSKDRSGNRALRASTPLTATGATDQHSILQQVMEGARDKFVVFTRCEASEKGSDRILSTNFSNQVFVNGKSIGEILKTEAQATQEALNKVGVQSVTLQIPDLNPEVLGELFMFYQLWVACLGEALNIDAFDQPGVELGKQIAKEKLKNS